MESPERNYDGTGGQVGSGAKWLSIDSENGCFWIGKKGEGKQVRSFAGYLDKFDIDFESGNVEKKIRPHWRIVLTLSAKDDDGEVKKFNVAFPMYYNILMPNVMNTLAALSLDWGGYLNLILYKKTDKPTAIIVQTRSNQPNGEHSPVKYPFNKDNGRGWIGVPEPEDSGVPSPDGKGNILLWWQSQNLWLNEAKDFYRRINGVPYTGPIGPQTSVKKCYLPDRPDGSYDGQQKPQSDAPPTQPASDKTPEKFFALFAPKLAAITNKDTVVAEVTALFNSAKPKFGDYGVSVSDVEQKITAHLIAVLGNLDARFENGQFQDMPF